jgi:hypothetical protein
MACRNFTGQRLSSAQNSEVTKEIGSACAATSGIVNRSTYSVQPGTYRLVLRYRIILTCTAPFEYVLFPPSTYSYVLFSPSTYSVRTWTNSMYRVRTEYRKHDKSTYFRRKVQTFVVHTSTYQYVLSTYFFAYSCTDFSSFRKGTYRVHADSGGVPTLGS